MCNLIKFMFFFFFFFFMFFFFSTKMPHKRCVAFCYINKLNFVDGQDSM